VKPRLSDQIARQIVDHIKEQGFGEGRHLGAQELADAFKVSRAPVTAALKLLAETGIVRSEPNRGFFVAKPADQLAPPNQTVEADEEDPLYFTRSELEFGHFLALGSGVGERLGWGVPATGQPPCSDCHPASPQSFSALRRSSSNGVGGMPRCF